MAAAAAAAAAVHNTMDAYLEHVIGMNNQGMRGKMIAAGFTNFNALVKKGKDFAHKACMSMRKSTTGRVETKDVTMAMEESAEQMVVFAKYRFLVY